MNIKSSLARLISLGGVSLNDDMPPEISGEMGLSDELRDELLSILIEKNGFYAFESALHFFPARTSKNSIGVDDWNRTGGWRDCYGSLAEGCIFFAEDIFGGQFCISGNAVWRFDPETGDKFYMGNSLEGWAREILGDFEFLTGYPIAHSWQQVNGPLSNGLRLVPRTPFVLNGDISVENLISMDAERSMRIRGALANEIINLPDGARIEFRIEP